SIAAVVSCAIDFGVRATLKRRDEAAAVTASFVCADSIVAISTWEGSSCCSFAIFSTAGSARPSVAFASRRITSPGDFVPRNPLTPSLAGAPGPAPLRRLTRCARSLMSGDGHGRQRLVAAKHGQYIPHREIRHRRTR